MSYTRRINVRGIIFNDGKLFAQTIKGSKQNYWCTPGGGVEDGESLLDGLHREMMEETGIAPVIGRLLFVEQFHDGTKENLEFFFHITNVHDYNSVNLDKTSHGMVEIAECGFIAPDRNNILPAFLQSADLQKIIDSKATVQVKSEL